METYIFIPYLSLREGLKFSGREINWEHYTITRMGNFWVSTQEGWDAEECFELRPCEPDWADSIDLLSQSQGVPCTREELEGDTEMGIITRKALLPFVDARFETVGEKLCLQEGVAERIQDWEKPHSSAWGPVQVTVIPSLIYQSDAQMAMGKIREEDDGPHHAANLYTYYLGEELNWMSGLSFLSFSASYNSELVLLTVGEAGVYQWDWVIFSYYARYLARVPWRPSCRWRRGSSGTAQGGRPWRCCRFCWRCSCCPAATRGPGCSPPSRPGSIWRTAIPGKRLRCGPTV